MPVINLNPPPTRVPKAFLPEPNTRAYFMELNDWALKLTQQIAAVDAVNIIQLQIDVLALQANEIVLDSKIRRNTFMLMGA